MKYFIELSYKGTRYHGWQIQKNAVSVQEKLNHALSLILGEEIASAGSGRTDTGVHAICQVAHFETGLEFDNENLVFKLNSLLPEDVAIRRIRRVNDNAHARFDATNRSYIYRIILDKDPFLKNRAYYLRGALNIEIMNEAASLLKTYNDFESFSKVKTDVNNFNCSIKSAEWIREDNLINFYITSDRFLRGMVRAIVGTMLDLGQGKSDLNKFKKVIETRNRNMAGRSVPPHGLYLSEVKYPKHIYKVR